MESFLPDSIKAVLGAAILVAFLLNRLSYAFPHVEWLQHFRLAQPDISEREQERRRRAGNRIAALEIAAFSFLPPILYVGSSIVFFNDPDPMILLGTCLISAAMIGFAAWLFVKNCK